MFTVVSTVGLVVARPYIKRSVDRSVPDAPTNVDALTGRHALTLTEVDERGGQVKLQGETWSARTADRGVRLAPDTDVVVVRIDGATALVRAEAAPPAPPAPPGTTPTETER